MQNNLDLIVDTSTRIRKPLAEVFEAVVAPAHLNRYFTQASNGRLEQGATVKWKFSDSDEGQPVQVIELIPNQKIVMKWEAHKVGYQTTIEMFFEDQKEKGTLVRVKESGWKSDEAGLRSSYSHTEGWVHMQCCMKAYMEFNIDLRSGGSHCSTQS